MALTSAQAISRLQRYGPNALVARDRLALVREIGGILLDPMAVMLAATAAVYLALGEKRDGFVMLGALVPVLGVDAFLNLRSRAALKKLAQAVSPRAHVLRDGAEVDIPSEEVVPGDALALREGDVVHADGVVETASNLSCDEASLTGESEPQLKEHGASFYAGSRVLAGQGWGRVTQTGARTRFGDAARLAVHSEATTPLQRRIGHLVSRLTLVALAIAASVFALGVLRHQTWSQAFISAVSLAMAAVPEEFPIVFTLFLSVGAYRLTKHGMLVRRLASVETLGSTTVICTDKTGTLTQGHFTLDALLPLAPLPEAELLDAARLACEREPVDPIDRAIAEHVSRPIDPNLALARDYDFDPAGKHMSHVWVKAGKARIVAKGALEGILAHCAVSAEARRTIERQHDTLTDQGMRVLALAQRELLPTWGRREDDERDLVPIALLGFRDPIRPGVAAAVAECQAAGVGVKIITGDHALTAHAIAHAAGITHEDDGVLTGEALDAMDERAREAAVRRAAVFARITPRQKHAIVDALVRGGEIVAMTGDGINDVPALRRAHIGISMGKRATEVARAAADLVLLDDDFASIVKTIREGRHLFGNIQAVFLYILAFHVPIVTLAFVAPLMGIPLVLEPIHLVWLELIVHPVSALVFQADPPQAAVMRSPPRAPQAPLLPWRAVAPAVCAGAVLTLAAYVGYVRFLPESEAHARAVALAIVSAGYASLVWTSRRALDPARVTRLPRSPWSYLVWLLSASSFPVITLVPSLARVFHVVPLSISEWLGCIATGVAAVIWQSLLVLRPRDCISPGARGAS